ncbi:GGDEF domain-containing protein [Actinoplanes sp. NPDC051861]|uniref:GGDEF domain-containing protein n=1 Tax=Actinoplanes sp. NPDC051861 TaxID=3155170 RepID=UPI00341BA0A9
MHSTLARAYRLSLALLVILMLVPTGVSAWQLWAATQRIDYVAEVGVPGAHLIGRIDGLMNKYRKEQWEYLALDPGDPERTETVASMSAEQAEMRAYFTAYRALPLRAADDAALARFESTWTAYLQVTAPLVSDGQADADIFNAGRGEELWDALKADVEFWRAQDVTVARDYHADSRRWSRLSLLTIGGLLVVALLLVAKVSRLMRRRVSVGIDRLSSAANHDALTGVPNRRAWDRSLAEAVRHARPGVPLSVAMIDIDYFKEYNDTYGHPAGDALLRDAAAAWRAALRPHDLIARYGGEEFTVLISGLSPAETEALVSDLRARTPYGRTFSAGIAAWDGSESPATLVRRADQALYEAKRAGRNRVNVAAR